jgi:predicted alpha/beta-hydrolase family hydrolase
MGARAAVMAATPETEKLVLVSYPLAGGEERSRILLALSDRVEVLFIIGEKDEMCDLEMLSRVRRKMKCKTWLIVVRGADHGMCYDLLRSRATLVHYIGAPHPIS